VAETLWNEWPIGNGLGNLNQYDRQMIEKYVPMMISVADNGERKKLTFQIINENIMRA